MNIQNCVARLDECISEMLLRSGSAADRVLVCTPKFTGLGPSDFPLELAQEFRNIRANLRGLLSDKFPDNSISPKDARRLIERIFALYRAVVEHNHKQKYLAGIK